MRTDADALKSFADLGLRLFWFRQVMFIGATIITTSYLGNFIPLLAYLVCLAAELTETYLGRRIKAEETLTQSAISSYTTWQTVSAAWSSLAIIVYGVIVADMGEDIYFFVPLTYILAAALYATIFNHHIQAVLVTRMTIYAVGFIVLGVHSFLSATPDNQLLGLAQLATVVSASFFFVINAIVFRVNYCERRFREREHMHREQRLRREIEERRSAELAKQSSQTRFKSLFENAPIPIREEDLSGMKRLIDGLNMPDRDAFSAYLDDHPEFLDACAREIVVVDANRASLLQHGYTDKTEMLEKVVRTLSPAAKKIVRKTVTTIHNGEPGASYVTQISRTDGEVRNVHATWSVVPGYENTYARILLCSIDVTERLTAEAALRQAQKMEAVGQLTGGVAHDFNNLLTVISGNVELLEETRDLDRELSDPIKKAVSRGAELVQRLLAFSRKQPLSAQAFDLNALVNGMNDLLRRSLSETIEIKIDIPKDLWRAYADPIQVETALLNLGLNARDAMVDGGSLTVSAENVSLGVKNDLEADAGDYIALHVTDTGTGMPPDVVAKAFEPFYTTKEVGSGSGLGLSMVYGFAKQSGGTLQIQSKLGSGSTISIFLPRAVVEETPCAATAAQENQAEGFKETILLLEDDDDVRKYLSRLMRSLGYKALQARDALEARHILASEEKIDLLVSDVMLPGGIHGPEFAAEMLEASPTTPVIFVSGRLEQIPTGDRITASDSLLISKPFTKDEIATKIKLALKQTGRPAID